MIGKIRQNWLRRALLSAAAIVTFPVIAVVAVICGAVIGVRGQWSYIWFDQDDGIWPVFEASWKTGPGAPDND